MRDKILREILKDKELMEKYNIREKDLESFTISPSTPYTKKIVEVLATIIKEDANHLSDTQIYKKIKNIHKI